MLKNFDKKRIMACSYDFVIKDIFKHKQSSKVIDWKQGIKPELKKLHLPYVLKPGELILARTKEVMDMPMDVMGSCCSRGVAYRSGLNLLCSIVPPGFKGELVFGIKNDSDNKIKIYEDLELLQITFFDLKGDPVPFQARFEGGKVI